MKKRVPITLEQAMDLREIGVKVESTWERARYHDNSPHWIPIYHIEVEEDEDGNETNQT